MFERLLNWIRAREDDDDEIPARASALGRSGAFPRPETPARPLPASRPKPAATPARPAADAGLRIKPGVPGTISDLGPGKNVLVAGRDQPTDQDPDDVLALLDESGGEPRDDGGIDPYNTGKFDRSRNWDKRFR